MNSPHRIQYHHLALSVLTLFILTTLGFPSACRAQAIINSSFEDGTITQPFSQVPAGSTAITGWTVGGGGVDYVGTFWLAGDGARSIDLSMASAGTVSQTITGLQIGQPYQITFLMAGNTDPQPSNSDPIKSLQLTIGSFSGNFSFDTSGRSLTNMGWTSNHLDFVPTSTSATVTFTSLEGSFGPAIDNVQLVQTPEPSTFGLLSLATTLLISFRPWQRKKGA